MYNDMENMWLAMKGGHYKRTAELLREKVHGSDSPDVAMDVALAVLAKAVHAVAATIWIYEASGDKRIHPRATYNGADLSGISLGYGEGIAGQVIAKNEPVIIADCEKDARFADRVDDSTGFKTLSMICVPMSLEGKAFGSIQIINKTDGLLFDEQDRDFAAGLAVEMAGLLKEHGFLDMTSADPSFSSLFLEAEEEDVADILSAIPAVKALSPAKQNKVKKLCLELRSLMQS